MWRVQRYSETSLKLSKHHERVVVSLDNKIRADPWFRVSCELVLVSMYRVVMRKYRRRYCEVRVGQVLRYGLEPVMVKVEWWYPCTGSCPLEECIRLAVVHVFLDR